MATAPLVSVIIPFYAQADYLPEAVASALNQTYQNCEIIVVDDASPDGPAEKLLGHLKADRLRIISNSQNEGPSSSRNKGIAFSSGDLIVPLDADDLILPDFLEKTVSLLQKESDVTGVYTDVHQFGDCNVSWRPIVSPAHLLAGQGSPVTMLLRREVFTATGGYKPHLREGENSELLLAALEHGFRFAHIAEELFHYRRHGGERTRQAGFIHKAVANLVREHRQLALDNLFEILMLQYELRNRMADQQRNLQDYCQKIYKSQTTDPLSNALRNSRLKEQNIEDFPPPAL